MAEHPADAPDTNQADALIEKSASGDRTPGDKTLALQFEKRSLEVNKKTLSEQARAQRSHQRSDFRVDQRVQQARLNVEISQELTVNDYFILYLSQFKNREAFVEAAKKLTPEEAADLMIAYQKHLTQSVEPAQVAPATLPIRASAPLRPSVTRNH